MKTKKAIGSLIAICLLGTALAGCSSARAMPQETVVASRGNLTMGVEVEGNLEMPHAAALSFGTTGVVEAVLVDEGDRVVEGQVLATLDAASLESGVRMAEADYEAARISLMDAIDPAYSKTGTDLPGVWIALENARDEVAEAQALLDEGDTRQVHAALVSIDEYLARAEKKSAATQWQGPAAVTLLELQVDRAEAALDRARLELAKATIVAPFEGVVTDVPLKEGQQISAMNYANPAISLVDTGEIEMSGFIDEMDIPMVKPGREAVITLDALPQREVKGTVTFVSQTGSTRSGVASYKTTITLVDPDEELRDGMTATAHILGEGCDNVLLLPSRAIQGSTGNRWVEVSSYGQSERRRVVVGLSNGATTEIRSGLAEGERVVLPGAVGESSGPFWEK